MADVLLGPDIAPLRAAGLAGVPQLSLLGAAGTARALVAMAERLAAAGVGV